MTKVYEEQTNVKDIKSRGKRGIGKEENFNLVLHNKLTDEKNFQRFSLYETSSLTLAICMTFNFRG